MTNLERNGLPCATQTKLSLDALQNLLALAEESGGTCPSNLERSGAVFIHCSTPDQLVEVANYLFRGERGLVLLVIDPDRVISPIRYEDAGNGKLYPHIYGPLNSSAVVAVEPFEPSLDGTFELPKGLT
ncbi:DUF952 domain-containing protein [Bradyrhizobium sp. USDA 10063]